MTPEALFEFVTQFSKDAVAAGSDHLYPTYREISARFGVTFNQIEDACNDWDQSEGYMQTAVGFSNENGMAEFKRRGDYFVEAYK